MRERAGSELDRIAKLQPGRGSLDLFGFAKGTLDGGKAGAAVEYRHRVSESWSAFGLAEAGYRYGERTGAYYEALAGMRLAF